MSPMKMRDTLLFSLLLAGALGGGSLLAQGQPPAQAQPQAAAQQSFSTPEEALQSLLGAVTAKDRAALARLFAPEYDQLLSGDPVEDERDLNDFGAALQQSAQLQKDEDSKYTLLVGKDNWPMPIPIVKRGSQWLFDAKAGLDEIFNRRIGDNELSAVTTCRAYVVAQWEYFTQGDHDNDGVAEYAQKFMSSAGQHDGLYWETAEGETPSPLGSLVAEARAEGYGPRARIQPASAASPGQAQASQNPRRPYHGYYFKILTRQGPHAPGGRYSYIINGNMIGGYALIAYPARWGNSGVMTFIVNQQGRVYQKNLGADPTKLAAIAEYDPDSSWQLVDF